MPERLDYGYAASNVDTIVITMDEPDR